MLLRYSDGSPYARKVRVFAIEKGVMGEIEGHASNPWDAPGALIALNPLGKIPTLVARDGTALYDSPVICEYLEGLADRPRLIPAGGMERLLALRTQALADGVMDAAVLLRVEMTQRKEGDRNQGWIDRQVGQIDRPLDAFEAEVDGFAPVGIGEISIACALGYLDFRHGARGWRTGRPKLAAWFAAFERRPSMVATHPGEAK